MNNTIKTGILFLFTASLSLNAAAQKSIRAFKLTDVRLMESPFLKAELTDKAYMLSLNPDRLLAPYLKESGLTPKATSYGNWENTGLDGHIGGHNVSALALMYAATGDAKVKERLDYMIDELRKCQDKNGNGYLSGVPGGKEIWKQIKVGQIKSSSFSLNDKWVPLYNIHKIYAGLYDAYAVAGNQQAKQMLVKLTDWCVDLVSNLSDQQIQELLKSEHGGLNEIFADVYIFTADKKYLKLARQFSDQSILKPLLNGKDALNGLHANTQIPKVIGFEQVALADHDTAWANAADFFWKTVVQHRTVAIGGNSVREHFHPANDFSSMLESREGPETCNSYNMLKLTKQLFLSAPSTQYLDYYERTLYNHILSSQREKGGFVYFTPMRPGHYRTYSAPQQSFWCCVGSGLENHGKYGELIYAHDDQNLYVNLFIPSKLNWKEKGITLVQETSFPNTEFTTLKLAFTGRKKFAIRLRHPSWLENGKMQITVNGKPQTAKDLGNGYVSIDRLWSGGDAIKVNLPMQTRTEFMPDGSDWVAFVHGPIVLAAELDSLGQPNLTGDDSRMGHIASGPLFPLSEAPLVSGNKADLAASLKTSGKEPLTFTAENAIYQQKYKNLKLVPFSSLAEKRYVVYFPYASTANLPERAKAIQLAETEKMKLENETIDVINTGEQQPESDHGFKGEKTETGTFQDRHYRNGTGWFAYTLKNKDLKGKKIRLTLYGKEKNRSFSLLVNGTVIQRIKLDGSRGNVFYTQDFEIPSASLTSNLELKFQADEGSAIPGIYEVRLVK
ncbi:glycoside hydrolase family 127 protein [Pedobacter sp. BMA]|uniref:glycoside hydrolase family 127 protein n=1 Tax=Pedobacter sp. BMA TaxID=1663685 RepID=UPI00069F5CE6|nr:glycoside hydrolase family 127 protein [Pedobacter sp. BMA]